ncbi:AAA family ATPase [Phytohabitans flavus]|uniref:Guanylate cyclase n=1 Tax=Phytohabitans flavus TaxID=1076124 RepID=A0A6F8XR84_9ACTN|nr:guanylate cyclase [Phytohabitans flavus]
MPEPAPSELRFVTVVFCDVVGSTEMSTRLSPDVWGAILSRYFAAATEALSRVGGRVEKFIGDAIVAVFGAEQAREDDAAHAVRAACAIREHAVAEGNRLRAARGLDFAVRLGVASGRVAVAAHRDSSFAIGDVLNRAARLQSAAAPGEVVVDARTWLLTRGAVTTTALSPVPAKGFPSGLRAWRVDGAQAPAQPDADPAFVGRDDLLSRLAGYLRGGLDARHPAVALVEGEAGIGKSRLLDRCWQDLAGDVDRVVVRCTADGSHVGLRSLLGLDEALARVDGRAAQSQGAGVSARTLGEVRWAIRGRLTALAARRPVLLVVEDTQWVAPALMEFLADLVSSPVPRLATVLIGRDVPIPVGQATTVRRFPVPPLDPGDSRRLATLLCGDIELHDGDTLNQMVERSGGNPLYLTQLATLAGESDGRPDLFPPSAEAAVGANLDLLSQPARRLLALLAAFAGRATVADLTEAASTLDFAVEDPLAQLVERRLAVLADGAAECTVPMAAEVAYRRLTVGDRASVHEKVAELLRPRVVRDPPEVERVAHHAASAYTAWREFNPGSDDERRAATDAARSLCAAGRFAILHSAIPVALGYVTMARDVDVDDATTVLELAAVEAYARFASGEPQVARSLVEAALRDVDPESHRAAAADLILTAAATAELFDGERDRARIARAQALARRSGDPGAISRALLFQAYGAIETGDIPAAQSALEEAATLVRQASGSLSRAEIYGNLALCLANGDQPAAAALETCERLYREAGRADLLRVAISCPMAYLQHMAGHPEAAVDTLSTAGSVCDELGHRHGLAAVYSFRAALAERDDDLPRAAELLGMAADVYGHAGLNDPAGRARARQAVMAVLAGSQSPSQLPTPHVRAARWADEVLALVVAALRDGDATPLADVLRVLDGVRGAGVRSGVLLTCVRVARRLGDLSLVAAFGERVQAAVRLKSDVRLLELVEAAPERW